jgi:ATP-dependent exoDNAse (exonuclease V) alpha subunit
VADLQVDNRLVLTASDGQQLRINPRRHIHLSVYESSRTELALGDWARVTRNDPALDVSNGDRVRVVQVERGHLAIETEKGRRVALNAEKPLHLEHAYATTVHSAQGLSLDRVYVAISRARYEARIYTNSRAELPAAIGRENVKTAALDIQRRQPAHARPHP